jgi:hypothetical protein
MAGGGVSNTPWKRVPSIPLKDRGFPERGIPSSKTLTFGNLRKMEKQQKIEKGW